MWLLSLKIWNNAGKKKKNDDDGSEDEEGREVVGNASRQRTAENLQMP